MAVPDDIDLRIAVGLTDYAATHVPQDSVPTSLVLPPAALLAERPLAKWLAPAAAAFTVILIAVIVLVIGHHGRPQIPVAVQLVTPTPTARAIPTASIAPTSDPTLTPNPTPVPTAVPTAAPAPVATAVPAPQSVRPTAVPAPPTAAPTAVPAPSRARTAQVSLTGPFQSVTVHSGDTLIITFGGGQWSTVAVGSLAGGSQGGTSARYVAGAPGMGSVVALGLGGLPRNLTVNIVA